MRRFIRTLPITLVVTALLSVACPLAQARGQTDEQTVELFRHAEQSADFVTHSYGYAVFPTIGQGGMLIGAAHGKGHVYERGKLIGNTSMTQVSVGFQLGGQAYSEIIFFKDKAALDDFTSGNFEFSAQAGAIAITAAADVSVGTGGTKAGASLEKTNAATAGQYQHGLAVFTIARGGLMYQATIAGQKFSFTPRTAK